MFWIQEENESMVKQLFFRNNSSISRQELKTAFNYHCKTCSDEQELAKLANLYFLYNVFIPRQNHNGLERNDPTQNSVKGLESSHLTTRWSRFERY